MTHHGTFIVIDGPDGTGTTTHSALLASRLKQEGRRDVVLTAEPSDGAIGTFLREQLRSDTMSADALQLLFCADRSDHIERVIRPALASGKVVVTDRYIPSTLAYGQALGLDPGWLSDVNKNFIQPDRVVFLLPPLSVALKRIRERGEHDELERAELQRRVRASYRRMSEVDPSIVVLDTSKDRETVAEELWNSLHPFL